jgi:hypothetical protein
MGEISAGEVRLSPTRTCGNYNSVGRKVRNQFVISSHTGVGFDSSLADCRAKKLDKFAVDGGGKRRKTRRSPKLVGSFKQGDSVTAFGCNPRALHAGRSATDNDHMAGRTTR